MHPIVPAFASAGAAAIGFITLIGWIAGIDALKAFAGPITTKANTAVGLIAAAGSLWLTATRGPRPISAALATFAGLLGALTLFQHVSRVDLGIDQALFSEPPGASGTASPGRMGPNACVSFMLTAGALLLLNRGRARDVTIAQAMALCVSVLALTATTGYFSGAQQLFAIARYTGIALQTALAFLTLSVGTLCVRTDVGPMAVFVSDRAGGLVLRRLVVPAIALPLLLGYASLAGQRAELFDPPLGTALFAMSLVVLLGAAIWSTAYVLNEVDRSRAEALQAVVETEGRFRALANEAPVLIWVDEGGKRAWFNVRWAEFTGIPVERLHEQWERLIHPEDDARYRAARAHAAETGMRYTTEYRLRRSDGVFRWVLETAAARRGSDGEVLGFVGSCVDITERRDLEAQAVAAREEAEAANRMKDDFLATLSHELRTPLNAILGYARMLRTDSIAESKRLRAVEVIERNALLQTQLVEDILDLSRITEGKLRLQTERLDLAVLVREAIESIRPAADLKGIQVVLTSETEPAPVMGDAARLQQVFWNVLSNAVKFTPSEGVVEVRLTPSSRNIEVEVSDNGIGIAPEFVPFVFQPFRQAESGFSRKYGGLGLGLSVSRRLTEMHGGTIEARSEGVGRGATFHLTLPRAMDTRAEEQSPSSGPAVSSLGLLPTLAGTTILAVDDDLDARELYREILQSAGARVITAPDARAALEEFARCRPDVVVSDLGMPGIDGYSLLQMIRAREFTASPVPAVAVTAYARSEDRARCLRSGFAGYVPKPIDPTTLVQVIASVRAHRGDSAADSHASAKGSPYTCSG